MKHFFKFFAAGCLLIAAGWLLPNSLMAQSGTLTIYDGTADNQNIPFNGYMADNNQHNQMVYPADSLVDMTGSFITQMVFYINPSHPGFSGNGTNTGASVLGTWTVSLGEVTSATLNSLNNTATLTEVYEGYFDCSSGTLTIEFAAPYSYAGGNLLIDLQHQAASYNRWWFLGQTVSGNSAIGYSGTETFLPKVSFSYGASICPGPQDFQASAQDDMVTLSWVANGASSWEVVWGTGTFDPDTVTDNIATVTDSVYVLNSLDNGVYTFYVRSVCGTDTYSSWRSVSATVMAGGCAIRIAGEDEWGDGWNGGYLSLMQNGVEIATFTLNSDADSTSIMVANDSIVFVWNSGMYDSEVTFRIYDGSGIMVYSVNYPTAGTLYTMAIPCASCAIPTDLAAVIDGSDVTLSWAPGNASAWELVYGTRPFNPDNMGSAIESVSDTTYSLTSLADGYYTAYVRTDCGGGDYSAWSQVNFVVGGCSIIIEGYDYGYDSWNGGSLTLMQGDSIIGTFSLNAGFYGLTSFEVLNDTISFVWTAGDYDDEVEFRIYDGTNTLVYTGTNPTAGVVYTMASPCPTCMPVANLTATVDESDVELAWAAGSGSAWEIVYAAGGSFIPDTANLTSETVYTNSFSILGLADGLYTAYVRAVCDNENSIWSEVSFMIGGCSIRIEAQDSYGDGWNLASVDIMNGNTVMYTYTLENGLSGSETFLVPDDTLTFVWNEGYLDDEISFSIYDGGNGLVYSVSYPNTDTLYTMADPCPSCVAPDSLTAVVNGSDVTLSWAAGNASAWHLVWDTVGVDPNTSANFDNISTNSHLLLNVPTGLYTAYVRTECGNDDYSTWTSVEFSVGMVVMNMATSGTDTVTACNGIIYDNGGPNGNHSSGCNSTLVLLPTDDQHWLTLSGSSQTEGSYDYLTIYKGVGTDGEVLFCDNTSGDNDLHTFGPFIGSAFTVNFHSDYSTNYAGFEIHTSCVDAPNCVSPVAVVLDYATPDSLVFSWIDTANNGANYWVEYAPQSDTSAVWTGFSTTNTAAAIGNLNSNTIYTVNVYTVCGANDTSYAVSGNFRTLCGYITTLPWTEDFNSVNITMNNMITCWDYMGSGYVATTSSYSVSGNGLGFYPSGSSTNDHILVLPPFDTITSALEMSLMIRPETISGNSGTFSIGYVTDINDATSFVETQLLQSTQMSTTFTQYDVVFPGAPAGSRIAMRHNVNSTSWYWFIDDINVHQAPACLRPAAVNVSDITETSATINISDPTLVGQYVVIVTNGSTVVDSASITDTLYQLTNLTNSTAYAVRVYSICSDGSTTNAVTTDFSTSCTPITNFPWTEGFESASILNCWDQEGFSEWEVGLGDYSVSTGAHSGVSNAMITHSSNGNTTKLITPVLALGNTPALLTFWHVQRSWGGDIDQLHVYYRTSPVDDWVLLESFTDAYPAWTLDSIVLPNTTSSYQIAFEMVDEFGYGVGIDDVTVTGDAGEPCDEPIIASTSVTDVTATLTWNNTGADSYEVAVVEGTWVAPASGTAVTDTTYTFTGLNAETQYTLGVRAVCGAGINSSWETVIVVTAGEPCEIPTNVTARDITFSGATIAWTNGDEETEWDLHVTGTNYDTIVTVQTNPYTLTGLNAAQEYTVTVRARCNETNFSEWSAPATFSTLTCQPVNDVSVNNITESGATVSWTAPAGVNNFEVEYGTSGFARGNGTTVTVSGTSYAITGLTNDMAYDVYVRSVCAEGIASAWSDAVEFTTLETQGIDDVASAAISLYPNPASTTVTIDGISGEATVTVVDMNGRVVITTQVLSSSVTLSLSDLAQGAYFVRITGEQVNAIRKLIVK